MAKSKAIASLQYPQYKRLLCTCCGIVGDPKSQSVHSHELIRLQITTTDKYGKTELLVEAWYQCSRCGYQRPNCAGGFLCNDEFVYESATCRNKDNDFNRYFTDENGMSRFWGR